MNPSLSQTQVSPRARPASPARLLALAAVALGLALTFLAAPPPAPAQAANGLEIGLQDDAVFRQRNYYDMFHAYSQARALDVSWMRVVVPWDYVLGKSQSKKKTRPSTLKYNWTQFDALVTGATDSGIKVQMVLTGKAPAFATANKRVGNIRPSGKRFGEFAKAAAQHFKGRVSRYSIWNEPNWYSWLNGPGNPRAGSTYRSLFQYGYSNIKKNDPDAKVLIGETAPYYQRRKSLAPLSFLRSVLCVNGSYKGRRCAPLRADGYAHHPYEFAHSPSYQFPGRDNVTMGTLKRLRSALSRLHKSKTLRTPAGAQLPVYLTEWGYMAGGSRKISDSRRATYTKQAFDRARKEPGVRQLLQYLLVKPPAGFPGAGFNTGIINQSGSTTAPYRALRDWAKANRSRITRNPRNVAEELAAGGGAPAP